MAVNKLHTFFSRAKNTIPLSKWLHVKIKRGEESVEMTQEEEKLPRWLCWCELGSCLFCNVLIFFKKYSPSLGTKNANKSGPRDVGEGFFFNQDVWELYMNVSFSFTKTQHSAHYVCRLCSVIRSAWLFPHTDLPDHLLIIVWSSFPPARGALLQMRTNRTFCE